MQLTRAADYAVGVMIHLAGLPQGARVSRTALAQAAECPEQFLSKVLQSLTRAGLVISHRGNTGGFGLPEVHRRASLLQVVEAVEGPLRLNVCLTANPACSRRGWCPAHPVWARALSAMADVLAGSSVGELSREAIVNRCNLTWVAVIASFCMGLAIRGVRNPTLAGAAPVLSRLPVIGNSRRPG